MKESDWREIEETLAAEHACYVLITCDNAKKNGNMEVQLRYGGDAVLASYLIDEAKDYIEDFAEQEICL